MKMELMIRWSRGWVQGDLVDCLLYTPLRNVRAAGGLVVALPSCPFGQPKLSTLKSTKSNSMRCQDTLLGESWLIS